MMMMMSWKVYYDFCNLFLLNFMLVLMHICFKMYSHWEWTTHLTREHFVVGSREICHSTGYFQFHLLTPTFSITIHNFDSLFSMTTHNFDYKFLIHFYPHYQISKHFLNYIYVNLKYSIKLFFLIFYIIF